MQTILMPIDFSDTTDQVVAFVAGLAAPLDAEVYVLYVSQADLDDSEQGKAALSPRVDGIVAQLSEKGCVASPLLVFGPVVESILDQIDTKQPGMVVMGSHGHGALYDLVMGSVAGAIMRSGKCPVLIVPSPKPASWEPDPAMIDPDAWNEYGFPFG